MSGSRSAPSMSLLVAGIMAGTSIGSCSKQADRSPTLETAASSVATVRAADSSPPARDSSTTLPAPDTPPAPVRRKPVGHPVPMPRPARDSLRVSPKPTTDSQAHTPAPSDSGSAPAAASGKETTSDKWLSYDSASNTVTFELIAGPFTFNGYRNGGATLVVPPKANMVINFVNKDGTPHSAIVLSGDGPVPNSATDPAIPRAYTNKALEGLPQEATDVMRFPAPDSGTYRIVCGVPGHALSGMWIWMKVDPSAKAPSFGPTKG